MLSVIVPFKNVEEFLSEALESIASQAVASIEIILVDDHSTDSSVEIARRFVAAHSNLIVKLVDSDGYGPGPARNTGLSLVSGEYLTFVDSDDRLPKGSLQVLLKSAQSNEADVVVGAIRRFDSFREWTPRWVGGVHSVRRDGVTAQSYPEMLRNNYGCGKLYSVEYWRAQELQFENSDVIYEDQPLISQLLWRARTINVLAEAVYDYRRRDDHSSISQRPWDPRDLHDRKLAWERTASQLYSDGAPEPVVRGWARTLFTTHLHWYLNSVPKGGQKYWADLRNALGTVPERYVNELWPTLTARQKIPIALLREDKRDLLLEYLKFRNSNRGDYRVGYDGITEAVPARVSDALSHEDSLTRWEAIQPDLSMLKGRWIPDSACLAVSIGYALETELPADVNWDLLLKNSDGVVAEAALEMAELSGDERDYWRGQGLVGLLEGEIDLSTSEVVSSPAPSEATLWCRVSIKGILSEFPICRWSASGGARELSTIPLPPQKQLRVVAGRNGRAPLRIRVESPQIAVASIKCEEGRFELTITSSRALSELRVKTGDALITFPLTRMTEREYHCVILSEYLRQVVVGSSEWIPISVTVTGDQVRSAGIDWPGARAAEHLIRDDLSVFRAISSSKGKLMMECFSYGFVSVVALGRQGMKCKLELPSGSLASSWVLNGEESGNLNAELIYVSETEIERLVSKTSYIRVMRVDKSTGVLPLVAGKEVLGILPYVMTGLILEREKPRGLKACQVTFGD